mmetsp:Transcript_63679/g.186287  ORF Transcript_63679/g.186287 Transcript_63679/m.186287 type:complete len:218 (+) Transcript_63679:266-919(+)
MDGPGPRARTSGVGGVLCRKPATGRHLRSHAGCPRAGRACQDSRPSEGFAGGGKGKGAAASLPHARAAGRHREGPGQGAHRLLGPPGPPRQRGRALGLLLRGGRGRAWPGRRRPRAPHARRAPARAPLAAPGRPGPRGPGGRRRDARGLQGSVRRGGLERAGQARLRGVAARALPAGVRGEAGRRPGGELREPARGGVCARDLHSRDNLRASSMRCR